MTAALSCPNCQAAMQPTQEGAIQLDRCPSCGTTWFDRTELAATVTHAVPGATLAWGKREKTDEAPLTCPRCRRPTLVAHTLGAARFYRCDNCKGVAVGETDLTSLLETAKTGGLGRVLTELFN